MLQLDVLVIAQWNNSLPTEHCRVCKWSSHSLTSELLPHQNLQFHDGFKTLARLWSQEQITGWVFAVHVKGPKFDST